MKTLQELYKEVIASDELKQEFMEAAKDKENGQKNVEEFLKKHECDATFDELKTFLVDKSDEELDEDELEAVAGGKKEASTVLKAVVSIVGWGLACLGFVEK